MAKEGIASRLELIVEKYCESKADLSIKLRQQPYAVRNWVSKGVMPKKMYERILERYPEINPDWLYKGNGEMLLPKEEATPAPPPQPDYVGIMMRNQLERYYDNKATKLVEDIAVMCGDVMSFNERENLKDVYLPGGHCKYMFRCAGISMEPRLHDGDYVGVNDPMVAFEQFLPDVMYLIFTKDGRAMVKYVEDPGMRYSYLQLRTLNEDYTLSDDGHLQKEEVLRIYKVKMTLNWRV